MWQCFIFFLDLSRGASAKVALLIMDFSSAHGTRSLLRWLWLNVKGNIIYQIPFPPGRTYRTRIENRDNISGNWTVFLWWWFSCPQLSTSLSFLLLVHPVISLVIREWWSRDNGMLSFHMRQEESLQAVTCFSTGEKNASCSLHIPASQQLSILHFLFIISSIFRFFISAGAATCRTSAKLR